MKFSRSFSVFRGVKKEPNSFNYKSRFYDSEQEQRDKRRKSLDFELDQEQREAGRISFSRINSNDWIKNSYKKQAFNSNVIIIVVLVILCFIAFAALKYLDTVNV